MHRAATLVGLRVRALLGAMLALGACSDGIAPLPDPPPTPYVVNSRGVRVFGASRVLVIPVYFNGGQAPTLSPEQLRLQLFGDRDDGITSRTYGLASNGRFRLHGDVAQ